ncbi:hypothetical protein STRIP9103_09475 [Streptomyces ipomoeae 91-03]|uniref:Uncharacterized protein n=1 Tax=Streptomyces ipomoeae 91-03 TaxID=698759 RepID=L1KHY0_9ACTN|nr:hypothetical protein STRIP9103_09475 [Streptomyces ipomoeae 91-03]
MAGVRDLGRGGPLYLSHKMMRGPMSGRRSWKSWALYHCEEAARMT